MSDFIAIWSSDADVRDVSKRYAHQALKSFGPHFTVRDVDSQNSCVVLGINPNTPCEVVSSSEATAVVMGFPAGSTPAEAAARFAAGPAIAVGEDLCKRLNYGMAVRIGSDGTLVCTSDFLGLYPLFIYAQPGLTICTSAPPLLEGVPGFRVDMDEQAIAHSLLLAHYVFDETAYKNVVRVSARTVLEARNGTLTNHVCRLPARVPVNQARVVDEFHDLLSEVTSELCPKTTSVLLSGGLDSRLLAGYLDPSRLPDRYSAVMIGNKGLYDVQFGTKAAVHRGLVPENMPVNTNRFLEWIVEDTAWDGAQSGGYMTHMWCVTDTPHLDKGPCSTGILGDAILGASHVNWSRDPTYNDFNFDTLFRSINLWGMPDRIIRRSMRNPQALENLAECPRKLRGEYESYDAEAWRSTWWFDLFHRQRFLVGRPAKLIAYRSWPVNPFADYRLIEYCSSLPYGVIGQRQLQVRTVIEKFPGLAKLPLDRGSNDTRSVIDGTRPSRLPWAAEQIFNITRDAVYRRTRGDGRFHATLFDMNSDAWRSVRATFKDIIPLAADTFDPKTAAELITTENITLGEWGETSTGSGRKAVMATLLWLAQHHAPEQLQRILESRAPQAAWIATRHGRSQGA